MASNYSISVDVLLNTGNIASQVRGLKDVVESGANIGLTFQEANLIMSRSLDIIESMTNQVYELDESLTEFKKVSELSGKALDNYIDKLSELGNLTSRTTKNVWSSV